MANLFAQNSANWDSANMWNTVANGSGVFVTPGATDVCMANGKTVTINVDVTVAELRNDTTGGATGGGGYTITTNGLTVTATLVANYATTLLTVSVGANNSATIVGNVSNTASGAYAIRGTNWGITNIIGTITAANAGSPVIFCNSSDSGTPVFNVTGSLVCNGGGTCFRFDKSMTITVTGLLINNSSSNGVAINTNDAVVGSITINGDLINYGGGSGIIWMPGTTGANSYLTINGNLTSVGNACINCTQTNNIRAFVINGNVTSTGGGTAIYSTAPNTITVNGTVYALGSGGGVSISNTNAALTVNGNVRGGTGLGAYGVFVGSGVATIYGDALAGTGVTGAAAVLSTGAIPTTVTSITQDSTYKNTPILGNVRIRTPMPGVTLDILDSAGVSHRFYTDTQLSPYVPSPVNVRYGVTYSLGGLTGTCRIPSAALVQYGVLVDTTTGTATINPEDIWSYPVSSVTTPGSIGERLKNVATIQSVGVNLTAS